MSYIIEKQVLSGFAYHPMNIVDYWYHVGNKMSLIDAKTLAIETNKIENGKYRVRDIYSGKVLFVVYS